MQYNCVSNNLDWTPVMWHHFTKTSWFSIISVKEDHRHY